MFDPNCQNIQIRKQLQTWISSTVLLSFFCSALTWFRHSHSKVRKKSGNWCWKDNKTWFTQTYPHAIKFAICVCFQRVGCIKCCIFTWNRDLDIRMVHIIVQCYWLHSSLLTNKMLIFFFVVCLWLCLQDRRNLYETTGEGAALGLSLSVKWPEPFSERLAP